MLSVATDGRHKQKNCVRQRLVLIESLSRRNVVFSMLAVGVPSSLMKLTIGSNVWCSLKQAHECIDVPIYVLFAIGVFS